MPSAPRLAPSPITGPVSTLEVSAGSTTSARWSAVIGVRPSTTGRAGRAAGRAGPPGSASPGHRGRPGQQRAAVGHVRPVVGEQQRSDDVGGQPGRGPQLHRHRLRRAGRPWSRIHRSGPPVRSAASSAPGSRGTGSRTSRRTGSAPAAGCPDRWSTGSPRRRRRVSWYSSRQAAGRGSRSDQLPFAQPNSGSMSPRIQSTSSRTPSSSCAGSGTRNSHRIGGDDRTARVAVGRCLPVGAGRRAARPGGLGCRHSVTVRHRTGAVGRGAYDGCGNDRRNSYYIRCAHGPSAAVRPAHPRGT